MTAATFHVLLAPSVQPALPHFAPANVAVLRPTALREEVLDLARSSPGKVDLLVFASLEEIRSFLLLFPSRRSRKLRLAFVAYAVNSAQLTISTETSTLMDHLLDLRTGPLSPAEIEFVLEKGRRFFRHKDVDTFEGWQHKDSLEDQKSLVTIGRALAEERDPEKLLRSILLLSKKMAGADAGSLFLLEEGPEGPQLRFKFSHTFSKPLDYEEFVLPLSDTSIAGYVASHRVVLNIPDVYHLNPDRPYQFNRSFDQTQGYRTKSVIAVPLISPGGEVLGVLQLINCKEAFHRLEEFTGNEAYEVLLETPEDYDTKVVPFPERYESLMEAVAAQAAIALENNRLFRQIEGQFEAFVSASVKAIEARDPPTSGHSFRVAKTAEALAKALNAQPEGVWPGPYFSPSDLRQLTLAALLHDFGKVYLDFNLFSKAKKLSPQDLEKMELRWDLIQRTWEIPGVPVPDTPFSPERWSSLKTRVLEINEPRVSSHDLVEEVDRLRAEVKDWEVLGPRGQKVPVLTDQEADNLKILRGSLNPQERKIIESHVDHSYHFVKNIPWPKEYARIPEIVWSHHEMLDGSGYPRGLKGEQISLEARILALADVYDALSAADRPYKKALPTEQVLVILEEEAQKGRLDPVLVDLFIREGLYKNGGEG